MHTIATRPPSPTEQRLIAGLTKPNVASWGCLAIIFGIVPALLLGALGGWLGGFISDEASTYGQWIGWILSAILLVSVVFSFFPFERRMRRRAARDQQDRIVQEIHVVEPRVIEIGLINDNEPILAFDVGSNKILFLQGQWLRDAGTYGRMVRKMIPVMNSSTGCRRHIRSRVRSSPFPAFHIAARSLAFVFTASMLHFNR
jgi:hypothetical protein